jgi:hypothetical protein
MRRVRLTDSRHRAGYPSLLPVLQGVGPVASAGRRRRHDESRPHAGVNSSDGRGASTRVTLWLEGCQREHLARRGGGALERRSAHRPPHLLRPQLRTARPTARSRWAQRGLLGLHGAGGRASLTPASCRLHESGHEPVWHAGRNRDPRLDPDGRLGRPEEIAAASGLLASDEERATWGDCPHARAIDRARRRRRSVADASGSTRPYQTVTRWGWRCSRSLWSLVTNCQPFSIAVA